ncbi:EF-hand domain-containing protein [Sphingomonas sp. CCH5-D11]|uniref:EF-hand domain-containing protein n=1 Tax=Sphingomonas sp. CCH5-D11 TaxID=1768786 RepID=UPI0009E6A5E1|nr:EF-hand domain-containing protein [Sphingomonas sp. CCH5-D11]
MLKQLFMASAMVVAGPVLAQDGGTTKPTAPSSAPGPAIVPQEPAAAEPAQAAATTTDQVSSIVNAEFASYDKDGNGTLEKAEFAAWMDALKAKAPDGGDKPGDASWNEAAFAKADTDKSTTLTRAELTGFLGASVKSSAG